MSKVTLSNVTTFTNDTSAVTNYNNNNAILETVSDNTLSRDGTSPNQMLSNLDMNSFHILNLPEPSSDTDPVRLIDLNVTNANLIHTASSTSNTIGTGTKTFTVPSGLGFQAGQYVLIQQNGNTANFMAGRLTSYTGTTLVANITNTGGSGTINNWTIDISGAPGATGSTGPTGPAGANGTPVNVYDTRTLAIAAAIPGTTNMVRTLAYDSNYTPESGAIFKRVATGTPFIDTYPTACSITGGSSYTNGIYFGVFFGGSATGNGMYATVTVSGNAITAVDFSSQPGNAFKIGDTLTCNVASVGGTGSGGSITITAVSTPIASFVNSVDNSLWQYMPDKGCTHVNQFGARPDWISVDSGTTNNFTAIQTALFFGSRGYLTGTSFDSGGYLGDEVRLGVGTYMINQPNSTTSLIIPGGVVLTGTGGGGSTIRINDSWSPAGNCICIGNPNAHFANFNCGMKNLEVSIRNGLSTAVGAFAVYSNNFQDGGCLEHVYIYSGNRGGLKYEISYGGGSVIKFTDLILSNSSTFNTCVAFNVGTSIMDCRNWSMGGGGATSTDAIQLSGTGGMYNFENIHIEAFSNGFLVSLAAGNNPMVSFKNITGGVNLAYVFTLNSTNNPGNASFQNCQRNNGLATGLVANGQSGGASRTADIFPKDGIVFFNP